jgi:hypothetical protein
MRNTTTRSSNSSFFIISYATNLSFGAIRMQGVRESAGGFGFNPEFVILCGDIPESVLKLAESALKFILKRE